MLPKDHPSQNNKPIILALAFIFCAALIINWLTPMSSDDFGREMDNLSLAGIWSRYAGWSGRLVADITATLVLRMGLPIANIINSIFLVLLIWILATLGTRLANKKTWLPDYRVVLLIFLSIGPATQN